MCGFISLSLFLYSVLFFFFLSPLVCLFVWLLFFVVVVAWFVGLFVSVLFCFIISNGMELFAGKFGCYLDCVDFNIYTR